MDRYERNIKQIEDAGKCPLDYFLQKTKEECLEVIEAIDELEKAETGTEYIAKRELLQGERGDLKNCLAYLDILYDDVMKIARIMREKVDRGYERGVE